MNKQIAFALTFSVIMGGLILLSNPDILNEPSRCDGFVYSASLGYIKVGSVISRGSFSLVMSGEAFESGKEVAIKIGVSESAGMERDKQILSSVNGSVSFPLYYGSGIATCEKTFTKRTAEYPYIILERLGDPVSSLSSVVQNREERIGIALSVATQILKGLEELHNRGYVLHDLYTHNVLMSRP